jgi:hypothetical protein
MVEPITATTIATLAFNKFIESGAGELAKKFTRLAKIKQLIYTVKIQNPKKM